jgi:DNA-directed RNA polymerase subunit RPC12/RpoP
MAKCLECGESINSLYNEDELCNSCEFKVLNDPPEKVLENQNIEKEYSKKNNYTLWNMLIIPFLFSYVSGLCLQFNTHGLSNLLTRIPDTIMIGYVLLIITYYPLKIFVFFLNQYTKCKWEWPYSLSFYILPVLLFLFLCYN